MRRRLLVFAVLGLTAVGAAQPASATFPGSNGPILYRNDLGGVGKPLFRARPDGSHVTTLNRRLGLFSDWRADGRRIAFDFIQQDGDEQIATMRRTARDLRKVTSGHGIHEVPSYSPNGHRIAFDASRQDPNSPNFKTHLWVMHANGAHAHLLPMQTRGFDVEPRYSPNGRRVAFDRLRFTQQGDQLQAAFILHTRGDHEVHRITPWSLAAEHPTWSPDSRWVLYNTPEGTIEKVRPSGKGRKTILAATAGFGGHKPWASPDGKKILFMCDNRGTLPTEPPNFNQDICVMDANGSNIVHIIDTPNVLENWPSWGPAAH
jgi:Tol biopolymer transport system component